MKHTCHIWTIAALLLAPASASRAQQREWKVDAVDLTRPQGTPNEYSQFPLRIAFHDESVGQATELTAQVHMASLDAWFVSKDKLAVLGHDSKQSTVVVFDLAAKREVDRFACFAPRRISDAWIVYVEWYPAHASGTPVDVVLAYDLALSPAENRLAGEENPDHAAYAPWAPARVGFPIYPDSNAQQKSYRNAVPAPSQVEHILGSQLVLLPSRKLVFSVDEGFDARTYRTHLEVIDLSQGLANPVSRRVELPTDKYPRRRQSPLAMEITRMEAVSPGEVRLYLPVDEYGVSSIVVDIER